MITALAEYESAVPGASRASIEYAGWYESDTPGASYAIACTAGTARSVTAGASGSTSAMYDAGAVPPSRTAGASCASTV